MTKTLVTLGAAQKCMLEGKHFFRTEVRGTCVVTTYLIPEVYHNQLTGECNVLVSCEHGAGGMNSYPISTLPDHLACDGWEQDESPLPEPNSDWCG